MKKTLQTKGAMAQSAHRRPIIALWSVLLALFPIAALVAVLTVGHLAAPKQAHAAAISGPTLTPGQVLHANDYVQSNNGQYKLIMQGDGNLVLYTGNRVLWNAATGGNSGAWTVMQGDGNFVVYSANGGPLWNSATGGNPGAQLVVQDDSNLVIYSPTNTPLWAAGRNNWTMTGGQYLYVNQLLQSNNGQYTLIMQSDGNLVLYTGSHALWQSQTSGNSGAWAVMQGDGNFVVYSANGVPLWNAGTGGNPGAELAVQDDGNLVVYAGGSAVWASNTATATGSSGKVSSAIQWFMSHLSSTSYEWFCEKSVENAYGTSGRYLTALANWDDRVRNGQAYYPYSAAPRGALVFYNSSSWGHVAISLGNGQIVSTNVNGSIGIASISYFSSPLGWAYEPW